MERDSVAEKFKSVGDMGEKIFAEFLLDDNISKLSRKYGIPYSTLRRYILERVDEEGISDMFLVQYFNIDDFPYLSLGSTFQFGEGMKIWKVIGTAVKESDPVFVLTATKDKGKFHYVSGDHDG
jgi:hypothetical protein